MIFYFSGTGNSLYIAKNIAEHAGEKLISISDEMNKKCDCYKYALNRDEVIDLHPFILKPPKIGSVREAVLTIILITTYFQ